MTAVSRFLFGADASPRQVGLILIAALVGMVAVAALTGMDRWQDWVLLLAAFDIFGGIVSNASASTRAHHAASAPGARRAFLLIHLAEVPIIWWLAAGGPVFWLLLAGMAAKLTIYALGVEEER